MNQQDSPALNMHLLLESGKNRVRWPTKTIRSRTCNIHGALPSSSALFVDDDHRCCWYHLYSMFQLQLSLYYNTRLVLYPCSVSWSGVSTRLPTFFQPSSSYLYFVAMWFFYMTLTHASKANERQKKHVQYNNNGVMTEVRNSQL